MESSESCSRGILAMVARTSCGTVGRRFLDGASMCPRGSRPRVGLVMQGRASVVVQVRLIEAVVRSGETDVSPDAPNYCDEAMAEAHCQYRSKTWMASTQLFGARLHGDTTTLGRGRDSTRRN